jgi:hypothetical protein
MSAATQRRWITMRAAAERLGIPRHKMRLLVKASAVETFQLPKSRPLVSAQDVERLAQQCQRPATVGV